MAEVYPTDAELIALLSEAETGVEYIPTGTAPYYLHFRKLLYRLLLATRRANDLRLYDEGGLTFGIKPGKFWAGNTLVEYAGSSGNVALDNRGSIYMHLDSSGTLVQENTYWPEPNSGHHVRLAKLSTSGGDITSIEDCRDQHSIAMPTDRREIIVEHTASIQVQHGDSGTIHTNKGATGAIVLSLPTFDTAGTRFTFVVQENQTLTIDPITLNISCWSGGGTVRYTIYSSTIGDCVTLVSDGNGNWMPTAMHGSWASGVS